MGAFICSFHDLSGFCGGTGFEVIMGHIFPQVTLAATTLVGYMAVLDWLEPEPEPNVNWGLYCAQWSTPPYSGRGRAQGSGVEVLIFRPELVLFPPSVCSLPSNIISTLVESNVKHDGLKHAPCVD